MNGDSMPGSRQPSDQANESTAAVHIYYRHLLLSLNWKADNHFTMPWMVRVPIAVVVVINTPAHRESCYSQIMT